MVSSLAPKAMSSGRLKSRNTTVSTRLADTAPVTQLPRIFSAPARSPRPRKMEARVAPPMAVRAAKAEMIIMRLMHTPTPVRAVRPTTGM